MSSESNNDKKNGIGFFPEPDPTLLVQPTKGFIQRVKDGYVLAIQKAGGAIAICGPGLTYVWPWETSNLLSTHSLDRIFRYDDPIKTKDDISVKSSGDIKYKFKGAGNPSSSRKLNSQPNADANISDFIKDIVTTIVKNSDHTKINHAFDVAPNNIPSWLEPVVKQKISSIFSYIRDYYGCDIEYIHMCDFNDPQAIIEAETDAKAQGIRNETEKKKAATEREIKLKNAQTDFEIEQLKAQIAYLQKSYDYKALYEAVSAYHLSTDQICDILKRQFTNTNATIIEANGGFDALATAILAGLKDYSIHQKSSSNGDSTIRQGSTNSEATTQGNSTNNNPNHSENVGGQDDAIDVDYTEVSDRNIPMR